MLNYNLQVCCSFVGPQNYYYGWVDGWMGGWLRITLIIRLSQSSLAGVRAGVELGNTGCPKKNFLKIVLMTSPATNMQDYQLVFEPATPIYLMAVCRFNKFGFCRFGNLCFRRHENKECENVNCEV